MGQNMDDVDPLLIVPDLRNEAVFVASNIEDSTFSNRIGMGEIEPRINQIRPYGVFGDPIPIFERLFESPRDSRRQFSLSQAAVADSSCWR
jgi:hypothetical protein